MILALIAVSQLFCGLPNDILPALTSDEVQPIVQGEVTPIATSIREAAKILRDDKIDGRRGLNQALFHY